MTMPRFTELASYWLRFPPAHVSLVAVKSALGIKPAQGSANRRTGTDDYEAPELQSTNDMTHLVTSSAFGDAFGMKKLKVVNIDRRKKS